MAEKKKRRYSSWAAVAVFFVLAALVVWPFIEPKLLLVNNETIESPQIPEGFDGFRIAHLSDIHHGEHFSKERARRLVDKVNALSPDLIVITGDYVYGSEDFIGPCFEELARLDAQYGVYSVRGNHDHWAGPALTLSEMARAGIIDIENRGVWIERDGHRFWLGGVDDLWESNQDGKAALGDATRDDFVVLLSHNPDYVKDAPVDNIDLMLCGHTHGGQVTFFGLFAPILPIEGGQRYRSGRVDEGDMTMIISRGIGSISPAVRFFSPPEIVLIELERKG